MLACENNNAGKNGGATEVHHQNGNGLIEATNRAHLELINHLSQVKQVKCECKKSNIFYDVHVLNETLAPQQICFILTIHDLGKDSSQFDKLIHHEKMEGIRNRVIWLNVNLPGQEPESPDLDAKKYPSLEQLGDGLVSVLDELKIPQVVCMGQGAGANIAFYFAIKHAARCLGLVLIDPVGSSAGLVESIRHIFTPRGKSISGESGNEHQHHHQQQQPQAGEQQRARTGSILRIEKTGPGTSPETFHIEMIDPNKPAEPQERRNSKNVALFADSFYNRACLTDKIHDLIVDTLIACGKNSTSYNESKKLYKAFQECNRKAPLRMVNSPFLELDNVASVLTESADRLAVSLQYFLQGIGLLSAMPLRSSMRSASICSGSPASPSHISHAAQMIEAAKNYERSTSLDDENGNPNHSGSSAASESNSESNSQSNLNNNNNPPAATDMVVSS